MKVYIALGIYPYEGNAVIGVYTSLEKAIEGIEQSKGQGLTAKGDFQEVYELTLNELSSAVYSWPDPVWSPERGAL